VVRVNHAVKILVGGRAKPSTLVPRALLSGGILLLLLRAGQLLSSRDGLLDDRLPDRRQIRMIAAIRKHVVFAHQDMVIAAEASVDSETVADIPIFRHWFYVRLHTYHQTAIMQFQQVVAGIDLPR